MPDKHNSKIAQKIGKLQAEKCLLLPFIASFLDHIRGEKVTFCILSTCIVQGPAFLTTLLSKEIIGIQRNIQTIFFMFSFSLIPIMRMVLGLRDSLWSRDGLITQTILAIYSVMQKGNFGTYFNNSLKYFIFKLNQVCMYIVVSISKVL